MERVSEKRLERLAARGCPDDQLTEENLIARELQYGLEVESPTGDYVDYTAYASLQEERDEARAQRDWLIEKCGEIGVTVNVSIGAPIANAYSLTNTSLSTLRSSFAERAERAAEKLMTPLKENEYLEPDTEHAWVKAIILTEFDKEQK